MYDAVRSSGSLSCIYFVIVISFGNIVMLNLFLAILLGNFDKARDFGAKKKLFQCFMELGQAGFDLSQCIDMILEDTAEYCKFSILKWNRRIIAIEKNEPSSFLRAMLARNAQFMERMDFNFEREIEANDEDEEDKDEAEVKELKEDESEPRRQRSKRSQRESQKSQKVSSLTSDNQQKAVDALKTEEEKFKESFKSVSNDFNDSQVVLLGKHLERSDTNKFALKDLHVEFNDQQCTVSKEKGQDENLLLESEPRNSQRGNGLHRLGFLTSLAVENDKEADDDEKPRIEIHRSKIQAIQDVKPTRNNPPQAKSTFSLMASIRGLFKSTKTPATKSLVEGEADVFKEKILIPSGLTVQRTKEIKNLAELIADSREYTVKRDNFFLHLEADRMFASVISQKSRSESENVEMTPKLLGAPTQFSLQNPSKVFESPQLAENAQSLSTINFKLGAMSVKLSPGKQSLVLRRKMLNQTKIQGSEDQTMRGSANEGPEEFEQAQKKGCLARSCNLPSWKKVFTHMSNSSLLIFHKDSRIRKFCIKLLLTPPPISDKLPMAKEWGKTSDEGASSLKISALQQSQGDFAVSQKRRKSISTNSALEIEKVSTPKQRTRRSKSGRRKALILSASVNSSDKKKEPGFCMRILNKCCPSLLETPPHKLFDNCILLLIFTSSVMLALDNPLNDPNSAESAVYAFIDLVHTVLFTIEMMIKIIGLGFFSNRLDNPGLAPYIRSTWNFLDFFVVMSSLLELTMAGGGGAEQLKSLKALRALRALRPLRMVSRNEGMKLVVGALMTSIPSMTNVVVVCLLLLLILAIVGVNLFKGSFYRCVGLTEEQIELVEMKDDCLSMGGEWANDQINFDNVGNAMMTLFQMMTTEGWMTVMYNGIDAVGVDKQPKKDNKPVMSLYFVAFMIVGSQFIINLFVGVVIDNFNKIKEKDEMGNNFVTQEQRQWIAIQKVVLSKNLIKELHTPQGYQKKFTELTQSTAFEYIITGCIMANTIAMGMVHYQQSEAMTTALEILNYIFAFVFNLEMILKLLAQGKSYFRQGWNIFDCFIVIGTDFGLLMKVAGSGASMGSTTSVIRGFRIMRIFRLVKASIALRLLIDTLLNILPQITNIMGLMCILLFIYAALGLNLFSQVKYQNQVNEKNNFRTFGGAMTLLMRCATGEDWNLIMYELANMEDCRDQDFEERQRDGTLGCGSPISYLYFLSYIVLITMLIINLSVAAVIQGLDAACQENLGIVGGDDINQFIELWKYYDPLAKGWIGAEQLVYLLAELDAPLGRKKIERAPGQDDDLANQEYLTDRFLVHKEKKLVIKKIKALDMLQDNLKIKMHKDKLYSSGYKVHYMEVLRGLLKRILIEKKQDFKLKGEIEKKLANMWLKKHKDLKTQAANKVKMTAAELNAVRIIENWRLKKQRQNNTTNKPETKKTAHGDFENFKEAQRSLAKARQNKALWENQKQGQNATNLEWGMEREREGRAKAAHDFDDAELVRGGNRIIAICHEMSKREKSDKTQNELLQNQESTSKINPQTKARRSGISNIIDQTGNRRSKSLVKFPNLRKGTKLTWHEQGTAKQLFQEAVEEQKCLELLLQHQHPTSKQDSVGDESLSRHLEKTNVSNALEKTSHLMSDDAKSSRLAPAVQEQPEQIASEVFVKEPLSPVSRDRKDGILTLAKMNPERDAMVGDHLLQSHSAKELTPAKNNEYLNFVLQDDVLSVGIEPPTEQQTALFGGKPQQIGLQSDHQEKERSQKED